MRKFFDPAERMWINQPSGSQSCHSMHGMRVIAVKSTISDGSVRVWFADGPFVSAQVPLLALSPGWPERSSNNAAK